MASKIISSTPFHYTVLRNVSAPEDKDNEREVYAGNAPLRSFLELPNDENIREYMLEVEGKKRKVPTQVHRAIRDTLANQPQNFTVLNSGIVVVAHKVEVDDKNKVIHLTSASIINGAQTQGELKQYCEQAERGGNEIAPINVKFEIIVTCDKPLIADISVARNFQNDVMSISIAGALGQLDGLKKAFQKSVKGKTIRMSETDIGVDIVATEKLLQVITALIPDALWIKQEKEGNGEPNKVYTYARKAQCLKEFRDVYTKLFDRDGNKRDDVPADERRKYQELYQFYLDIAGEAWELYEKWKAHDGFRGTGLRAIERNERGEIEEVPDGIVFPILAALSAFGKKDKGKWTLDYPRGFDDKELIKAAKTAYMDIAKSNPNQMGKTKGCYSMVAQVANIYKRIAES